MKYCAVDTETWGNIKETDVYHPSIKLSHLSWFSDTGKGNVYDIKLPQGEQLIRAFGDKVLANPKIAKVFWNARFDIPVLKKMGLIIEGPIIDAMIIAQLVCPLEPQHSLKWCAGRFLGERYKEEQDLKSLLRKNKWQYGDVPLRFMYSYALLDARCTLELFHYLMGGVREYNMMPVVKREMALLRDVLDMEETGIMVNLDECTNLLDRATIQVKKLKTRIRNLTHSEFNPNSNAQVIEAVYDEEHLPTRYTKTGSPSVAALSLLQRGSLLSKSIALFRTISKARTTYAQKIINRTDAAGCLHASFNQSAARTGRFSSSNPNLQNIPRSGSGLMGSIRNVFIARPGRRLVCIDYDQLELRLTAHFANEKSMIAAILDGQDLHGKTANKIFRIYDSHPDWPKWRYLSKTLNFAVNYGSGADTFCETVLRDTNGEIVIEPEDARTYITKWKNAHPGIQAFGNRLITQAAELSGIINHYGRFLPVIAGESYKCVNHFIQSTAADLMKQRMHLCASFLKSWDTHMVLTVHDELIFDVPGYEKRVIPLLKNIMEELTEFRVPLTCSVEVGKTWGSKKAYVT